MQKKYDQAFIVAFRLELLRFPKNDIYIYYKHDKIILSELLNPTHTVLFERDKRESIHGRILVPIENIGNLCYCIASVQFLLQIDELMIQVHKDVKMDDWTIFVKKYHSYCQCR